MESTPISRTPGTSLAANVATLGGLCTLLALGAGLLEWGWPFDLLAHFRVQYAVLLAAFALALVCARRHVFALVFALASVLTFWSVESYARIFERASPTAGDFRLLSYNAWFRTSDERRVAEYLAGSGADAIVLQELTVARARHLHALLPSYPHAYHDAAEPHGVVILSRWPILAAAPLELSPGASRASQVTLRWRDIDVTVIGVHLHWPLFPDTYRLLNGELAGLAAAARSRPEPLLITGDFNLTPWSSAFRKVLGSSGLSDCARGHGLLATWPSQVPPLGLRIDHCIASRHWRSVAVHTGPRLGSDHVATIADLKLITQSVRSNE